MLLSELKFSHDFLLTAPFTPYRIFIKRPIITRFVLNFPVIHLSCLKQGTIDEMFICKHICNLRGKQYATLIRTMCIAPKQKMNTVSLKVNARDCFLLKMNPLLRNERKTHNMDLKKKRYERNENESIRYDFILPDSSISD